MIFGEAEGCTTTRIEALNTDEPLIREDAQPCKVLRVDGDHEAWCRKCAQEGGHYHDTVN